MLLMEAGPPSVRAGCLPFHVQPDAGLTLGGKEVGAIGSLRKTRVTQSAVPARSARHC